MFCFAHGVPKSWPNFQSRAMTAYSSTLPSYGPSSGSRCSIEPTNTSNSASASLHFASILKPGVVAHGSAKLETYSINSAWLLNSLTRCSI